MHTTVYLFLVFLLFNVLELHIKPCEIKLCTPEIIVQCLYVTHSHQTSLIHSWLTVLQAKAVSGGLSGCFQIFTKLKFISIKLWCVCTDML